MIVISVLFAVNFPLNGYEILIAIMKLTNLDIIPTEDLLEQMFDFHVDAPAFSQKFEEAGY